MDGTDQISKAPSSRGRWWVKMGSSSDPWAIEAAKQARDRAGLAVNRAKETSSQTGYEGKVADEGQPWGSWMLLLPRALPETRDFWILPSLLGWGTARWDRPRFWLLQATALGAMLSPCLSGMQLLTGWHKREKERNLPGLITFFLSPKFEETLHVFHALLMTF